MKEKEYIYIVQMEQEKAWCKIGKTNDLDRRLKEYNNMTGKSRENVHRYLFACEVTNMTDMESDIKSSFSHMRETPNREMYFYNPVWFGKYIDYIKSHPMFKEQVFIQEKDKSHDIQIVKKNTPSLSERELTAKDILQQAKKMKNDEFYTRYEDIEKEVSSYDASTWRDKVVFCNCDDAVGDGERTNNNTSPFALYFLNNFHQLGLKKLICTHYNGGWNLFGNKGGRAYIFTREGVEERKDFPLGYTGSFDDPISLEILRSEADIVCTNPPFSLAGKYWKTIIESKKKFLIISNITNVKNHTYIPYFMNKTVWAGYNRVDWYLNPKKQPVEAAGHWFTNLRVKNRPKYKQLKIIPLAEIPEKYKKYDDAKILIVDNCYIPSDYTRPFVVSVRPILNGVLEKGYEYVQDTEYVPYINGKRTFGRVLIQKTGD